VGGAGTTELPSSHGVRAVELFREGYYREGEGGALVISFYDDNSPRKHQYVIRTLKEILSYLHEDEFLLYLGVLLLYQNIFGKVHFTLLKYPHICVLASNIQKSAINPPI
jgi:hypothetical protein